MNKKSIAKRGYRKAINMTQKEFEQLSEIAERMPEGKQR